MVRINRSRCYILFAILAVTAVYTNLLRYRPPRNEEVPPLDNIPHSMGGFTGRDEYQPPRSLKMLGADTTLFRSYRNGQGNPIWLFIGYFGSQQENSQIHSPKHCYPGSGWDIIMEGKTHLKTPENNLDARYLLISGQHERRLVIYWFHTGDGAVTGEFALKWFQMKRSLMRKPQSAAFIRFSTRIPPGGDKEKTMEQLTSFIQLAIPPFREIIRFSRCCYRHPGQLVYSTGAAKSPETTGRGD